jgi:hypothetical protein
MRACALLLPLLSTLAAAAPRPKPTPPPTPPEAAVPTPEARAREAKARGDAALDAGRPAEALLAYEEAARLAPTPALLYNRARAHEKLQQYPQALELLTRFSFEADAELRARVPRLEQLLAEYRERTTRLFIEVAVAGVEVRLGDRILGVSPLPQPLVFNAGPAEALSVASEAYLPVIRPVALPPGGEVHLSLPLAPRDSRSVLRVSSPQAGALATVDDEERGNVPLDAVVAPGEHRVRLTREGFVPAETTVLVKAGELRLVEVALEPERRLVERWYFWAAIGAVVAAGVGVGVAWSIEGPAPRGTLNVGEPPISPAALPRLSF